MKKKLIVKLKILLVGMAFLLLPSLAFGQMTITGTVVDADGITIPSVTVMVPGTSIGTITDLSGNYSIEVPANAENLRFSFVGYKTVVEPIQGRTKIDVT